MLAAKVAKPARAVIIAGRDWILKRLLAMSLHHLHAKEAQRFCVSELPFYICTSVSFPPSPNSGFEYAEALYRA